MCSDQYCADISLIVCRANINGKLGKKNVSMEVSARDEQSITLDTRVEGGARDDQGFI